MICLFATCHVGVVASLKIRLKDAVTFSEIGALNGENRPYFLDAQLPTICGTSFVKTLQHPPHVIFITAHPDHAIAAFELGAIDFRLKPVSFERFLKEVNRLINSVNYNTNGHTLSLIPTNLFVRIHRSFLVSVNAVTAITPKDVEIDNLEIPIGRQFMTQLKRLTRMKC